MKKICLLLVVVISMSMVTSIALSENSLTGVWVYYLDDSMTIYTFNADKTATCTLVYAFTSNSSSVATMKGNWKQQGSSVTLTTEEGKLPFNNFSITIAAQTVSLTFINGKLKNNKIGRYLVKVSD